jgi:hypothetical protein
MTDRVIGAYSADVSKLCSHANLITWRLLPDGVVQEVGMAPALITEDGSTYTWEQLGRWRLVGSLVEVSFDDGSTARFRLGHVRRQPALIEVLDAAEKRRRTGVCYIRWARE